MCPRKYAGNCVVQNWFENVWSDADGLWRFPASERPCPWAMAHNRPVRNNNPLPHQLLMFTIRRLLTELQLNRWDGGRKGHEGVRLLGVYFQPQG